MMATADSPITIDTTLTKGLAWLRQQHAMIAADKAAEFYGSGRLDKPVIITDGVRNRPGDQVKNFGTIIYVPGVGPIAEAATLAQKILLQEAPRRTGFYAAHFQWYQNGRKVETLDIPRIGARGNVEVADLASYAAMPEIEVPGGVLYAAYAAIKRQFGSRVIVRFGYRAPRGDFTPEIPERLKGGRPLNIPVLSIGNPGSTVKAGATAPGVNIRKRARRQRRRK
jgi:hypothetical protein